MRAQYLLVLCAAGLLAYRQNANNGIAVRLLISRQGNHSNVKHYLPPPSVKSIEFSPIFDKQFLLEVLHLKEHVVAMTTPGVTLSDICVKNQGQCVVESIFSYFQDSSANLTKQVFDRFGFFVMADDLDHLLACFRDPSRTDDGTHLAMSCLPDNGFVTFPNHTLMDFPVNPEPVYRLASKLVITLHIDDSTRSSAWLAALRDYVTSDLSSDFPNVTATLQTPYLQFTEV